MCSERWSGFLNGGFLYYSGLDQVDSVDMRYLAGSVDMGWSAVVVGVEVCFFCDYAEPRVLGSCS